MAQPTLAYGGTTVTLEYPQHMSDDAGMEDRHRVTLGGQSGIQRLYRKGTFAIHMHFADRSIWVAVRDLWSTAAAANAFPTFTFDRWANTAVGLAVVVQLGPFEPTAPGLPIGDFDLTLIQTLPY